MRDDRTGTFRIVASLLLAWLAGGGRAVAGPGHYDATTRTFNLTYTYAVVPSTNITPDQLDQLGSIKKDVGSDVDAKVRGYFAAVSDKLWQATNQRGKLGNLVAVDNVKQADIVVSPSGRIGRGGFANPGGFEDRQGHLVISYEDLTAPPSTEIDAQLTIFHELCHYLFALPDEYRDNEQAGLCPLQPSNGPGCLMDNYLFNSPRHGWYGRFCSDDHNQQAPLPGTVIAGFTAQQSCQQLIELFFQSHLKGDAANNPPAGAGTSGGAGAGGADGSGGAGPGAQPTPDDPFTGVFDSLVDATTSFLRSLLQDARDSGRTVPAAGGLRSQAEKFLRNQLAFGRQALTANTPTTDQIRRGVDLAIKTAQATPMQPPDRFTKPIVDQLVKKAREFAALELGKPGGSSLSVSPLTASTTARTRATTALQRRIETQLTNFARSTLGLNDRDRSSDQRALSPDERAYIKQVANNAATQASSEDNSPLGKYIAAARIHIQLTERIAEMSLETRDELGIPGTDILRNVLSDYERTLVTKYALPGRPYTGFGTRRTVIFAPMPADEDDDHFPLQASPSYTYDLFRTRAIAEIRSQITRERILLVPEDMNPGMLLKPADLVRGRSGVERMALVRQQITFLTDQVRRNRFDNIIWLNPPGGLSNDLGDELESLRKRMVLSPDVRLDIISVDTGTVPERLIDLCARSRGSWLFAPDLDAFGAVGQRLRGEGISGSWVIAPQQGRLDLAPTSRKPGDDVVGAPEDPNRLPRELPLKMLRDRLVLLNDLNRPGHPNPDEGRLADFLANRLNPAPDDRDRRVLEAFQEYSSAFVTAKLLEEGESAVAHAYAELYNQNFFKDIPGRIAGGPDPKPKTPTHYISTKIIEGRVQAATAGLPSLETMQADLEARGKDLNDVVQQNEFNRTIWPTITRLKAFREDLKRLDDALDSIDPDSRADVKAALDATIQAWRDLGDLPRDLAYPVKATPRESVSSVDSLYRSAAMRQALQRAILVRLQRFDEGKSAHFKAVQVAAKDPAHIKELTSAEKKYLAYAELSQQFMGLYRNLHHYDLIQDKEDPKPEDLFAKLSQKLRDAPTPERLKLTRAEVWFSLQTLPLLVPMPVPMPSPDIEAWFSLQVIAPKDQLYLQLMAEMYLDFFDLQNELNRGTWSTPAHARIVRSPMSIVQLPQQGGGQGNQADKPLAEQLLAEAQQQPRIVPLELKPFTAEEKASFDLIIGFTRSMNLIKHLNNEIPDDLPTLRLYSKAGAEADEFGAPFLQIDPAKTTDQMLVFRLPYPNRDAGRIAKGTYYPRLQFQQKHLPERGGMVDFTFSVASANPNVILGATLRQVAIRADTDEQNDDEVANRGIIQTSKSVAVIEALVTAGSPIRYVDVTGHYQKIETEGGPIASPALTFLDDGIWPDTTKEDGVYTAKITLDPQERRKQAIYQVLIEARSNDKTSFVPFEQLKVPEKTASNSPTTRRRRAMAPQPPQDPPVKVDAPKFQRATSVSFLVQGTGTTP